MDSTVRPPRWLVALAMAAVLLAPIRRSVGAEGQAEEITAQDLDDLVHVANIRLVPPGRGEER